MGRLGMGRVAEGTFCVVELVHGGQNPGEAWAEMGEGKQTAQVLTFILPQRKHS